MDADTTPSRLDIRADVSRSFAVGKSEGLEPIRVLAKPGLEDLIPNYLANRSADLRLLASALGKADMQAIKVIGHGMKGSGGGYGFPAITEIGRCIERLAVDGDSSGIPLEISNLETYLSRLEVVYS